MSNSGYIENFGGNNEILSMDNLQNPYGVRFNGAEGVNKKGVFTQAFWLSPPWGRPREINYPLLEKYEKNEWIQMIITHVMDSVVKCDYNIKATNENKITQAHIDEVTDFFRSKTWQESWKTGLRRMLPDLLLYDAGIFIKVFPNHVYDDKGILDIEKVKKQEIKPLEIVSRDGRSFLKDCDLYGYTKGYFQYSWIAPHAKPIPFIKDEIVYLSMRPQSRSPYGISPLETVMNIIDYLSSSVAANRKYWENGMFIGGQIDHPDVNDVDEMIKRSEMYSEALKGEQNYNKWLLTFGGTKVTPLAFTNQQMQWLETSEFFGRIVFAIFKITPSELGFTDGMNHATSNTQSEIYKSKGVQNILNVLEEFINREIIWKHFYDDVEFEFDHTLDLGDKQTQTNIDHLQLTDGVTTINEIRNRDGKEVYEDDLFNNPYAEMAYQDQMMSAGEEDEGEYEEESDDEMRSENAIGVDDFDSEVDEK